MKKVNTIIIPVIRPDLIERCLETLYENSFHNFYVIVIDQTYDGLPQSLIDKYIHIYLRPRRNLGFAKATNMGIKLVETPFFTMCNDDVEFINKGWWQGVIDAFKQVDAATPNTPCISVTPGSTKLPDWSIGKAAGENHFIIPQKDKYTQEDWDYLLNNEHYINEHLTIKPNTVIDGITFYCSVFRTDLFNKVGLLNERYYPGGAEDYDYCCRAYMNNFRATSTTKSWVFHHWSKSINATQKEKIAELIEPSLRFGDHNLIWGKYPDGMPKFDLWGVKCPTCGEHMRITDNPGVASCSKHPDQQYTLPETTVIPL